MGSLPRPIVSVAVEGDIDAVVASRLLASVGLVRGPVYGLRGKDQLDARLPGYIRAAKLSPWLVLRDLNSDAPCAPELLRRLAPAGPLPLMLRIVVRAVEAWLLADRGGAGALLQVPVAKVPSQPDLERDPKTCLVDLARLSSSSAVASQIAPEPGASSRVGPGYNALLLEFAQREWRPEVASRGSPRLARCVRALSDWSRALRSRRSR